MEMLSAAAAHEIKDVLLQSFWQCIQSHPGRSVHSVARLVTPPGNCFLCRFGRTSTASIYLNGEKGEIYKTVCQDRVSVTLQILVFDLK